MKTLKTELADRQLRFDGVSEVSVENLNRYLLLGVPPSKLRVTEETPEVTQFNEHVSIDEQLRVVSSEPVALDMGWQLPDEYATLDLTDYIFGVFVERTEELKYSDAMREKAIQRVAIELEEIEKRGMTMFMRTVIYILHQLKASNIVWGVGRGSSCASYLLFLIGLHVVDCVKLEVDHSEFFHD